MKKYCFGVDVGGTTVKIGFFNVDGTMLDKWEIVTNTDNGGEAILGDICKSLDDKLAKENIQIDEVKGIGIGLPGPVLSDGTVLQCVNLGWGKLNVEEKLSSMFHGVTVKAGNDANVAALGEAWKGGGKDYDDVVMITLGTGVGGGVIIGNNILTGYNGGAGEIGHFHMNDEETDVCGCGKKGCLEQYASATGIARIAREHLAADTKDSILRTYDLDKIDAKIVFDALKEGDQLAVDVVEEFGEYLAKGLADVAVVVDPSLFVIGGGVSKAGEILLTYIEKYYRKRAFFANKDTQFAIASLGNDAGICGAAKLILDSQV